MNLSRKTLTRLPGEAEAPHVSQTPDVPGNVSKVGPLPNPPTVCDWCGERTALAGGCQNERCPSR